MGAVTVAIGHRSGEPALCELLAARQQPCRRRSCARRLRPRSVPCRRLAPSRRRPGGRDRLCRAGLRVSRHPHVAGGARARASLPTGLRHGHNECWALSGKVATAARMTISALSATRSSRHTRPRGGRWCAARCYQSRATVTDPCDALSSIASQRAVIVDHHPVK